MTPELASPRPPDQRLHLLDALRGFALLGILLMNIEFFTRPVQDFMAGLGAEGGASGMAGWIVYVFVQGKFWVLFSLLFGMGFALMQQRLEADGRPFARLYLRRTLALAGFGLAHIVLLWPGDILLCYAITAVFLMLFLRVHGKGLMITGVILYFLIAGLWTLMGWGMGFMPEDAAAELAEQMRAEAAAGIEAARVYSEGGYLEISAQRARDYFEVMMAQVLMFQVPMALGVFLLGGWLLRSGRIERASQHLRFWWLCLLLGAAIGAYFIHLSLGIGASFDPIHEMPAALHAAGVMLFGNLPLSMAYLAAFVLLFQSRLGSRVLGVLAPAGRMALTHYLMQSLVLSLLFFGYGFGWYGQVDRLQQVLIALSLFATQVAISPLWLRQFRYGPMEWLWRGLTYGRFPQLHRAASQ
jgi:uncharacterized protein